MRNTADLKAGMTPMDAGVGVGTSNPMSGGSPEGYDRGGGTGRDKLLSGGMQSGKFAGVGSINISSVGKMPTFPTIKAGDIPAKTPKAPKLPTNPSTGTGTKGGAGMRSGAFNLGSSGGFGMRLD